MLPFEKFFLSELYVKMFLHQKSLFKFNVMEIIQKERRVINKFES